jgi:DNA-binding transcriptional MerR regulator
MAIKIKQYTISEFSEAIGVGVATLQTWDNKGLLIAHRTVGNRRYYLDEDIREYKARVPARTVSLIKTYTAGEFAKIVGVSLLTVQTWDNKGKLVAGRTVGNKRFYTQEHIDKATEGRKAI